MAAMGVGVRRVQLALLLPLPLLQRTPALQLHLLALPPLRVPLLLLLLLLLLPRPQQQQQLAHPPLPSLCWCMLG